MGASNMLQIGLSGLLGAQRGIGTTSHNINNINTEGFSRQRVDFTARAPQYTGSTFLGTGVEPGQIRRIADDYAITEMRASASNFNQVNNFYEKALRMDSLLGDASSGLASGMQSFFGAVQALSAQADSIPSRQVLMAQSSSLVQRFQGIERQFTQQRASLNLELRESANAVTSLARNIASLNNQLAQYTNSGPGDLPGDLLDKRDKSIQELAELVGVQVVPQDLNQVNVYIGNGQPLVVGSKNFTLSTRTSDADPTAVGFVLQTDSASLDLGRTLTGGKIGGAIAYSRDVLEPGINRMGLVAIGLANEFNQQHALGVDLNDQLGGRYFTDVNDPVIAGLRVGGFATNTGNAVMSVSILDTQTNPIGNLTDSDYELRYDGANYNLTRLSDGSSQTLPGTFPGVPADVEGFRLSVTAGAMASGDTMRIQPTKSFAGQMRLEITDPRQIAAASPIRSSNAATNTGTVLFRSVEVMSTSTPAFTTTPGTLTPPLQIRFVAPATAATLGYEVVDATTNAVLGTGTFNLGQDNDVLSGAVPALDVTMGYDLKFGGTPRIGDSVDITYNNGAVGDNRNLLKLVAVQSAEVLDGGYANLGEAYGTLVSKVGSKTAEAALNRSAGETLLRQAIDRRESISGVNLDEEAANLIKFQQAYQASAQVISIAGQLFDTLISSVR